MARASRHLHGLAFYAQQFKAMVFKRAIYSFRRWTQFIPQVVIPILYMALLIWTSTLVPDPKEQKPITIDMSPYSTADGPAEIYADRSGDTYWPGFVE